MKTYNSYKPSGVEWIGNIPENWRRSKYKYNISILSGFPFKSELFDNISGFPIMRIRDISSGKIETFYTGEYQEEYIVKKGDLVIGMDGEFNIRLWDNSDILLNQRCCKINQTKNIIQKYIYYTLPFDLKIINDLTYYTTVKHLSVNDLRNIFCIIPPLHEQEQIVNYLDQKTSIIDKLVSIKERKIELLKEQRSSLINQIITKGLNPNVKMKDSGVEWIGEIPESWNLISIKHLVSTKITDGPHETPIFVDNGVPFLSVESVQDGKLDFNKKRGFISVELNNIYSKKCLPKRDDVLIVKSGSTTGKSTIVETDELFNIWSPLCIVRSNKNKIIPRFTFTSIQSNYFRKFIEIGWSFGTQPNIGMGVIENLKLVVPTNIKEQQEIVDYLDKHTKEIDDLVSMEQKKIELLKEFRQSLISEVITGKIKVVE
jgi:type I restriction enzyme S subunit